MIDLLLQYEAPIRISVFLSAFSLLAVWEWLQPRRRLSRSKLKRWLNNFGLVITSTILVRILIPTAAVGVAYYAEKNQLGITSHLDVSFALKAIVTFILLDLIIYFQHLFFHVLPVLWRLHRVHHSDQDCDVSTGLRFHPIEIILSIIIKLSVILFLGAPVITVIFFELTLNFMSMFTHANIHINKRFDHYFRWFFTSPEMHRIHHSSKENETNSNFTFFISLWDRIFGTYLETPEKGHINMTIGLNRFNTPKWEKLPKLLGMPFASTLGGYVINNRDTKNMDELEKIHNQLKTELQAKENLTNSLTQALKKATESSNSKLSFISNISHEFRTPIHAVLSYSKFGINKIEKASKEKLLDYFEKINTSGNELLILVDDLITLANVQSGELALNIQQSNLNELLNNCIAEQKSKLIEKQLILVPIKTTKIDFIEMDNPLITQVLRNLLSNAINYSDAGASITVKITDANPSSLRTLLNTQQLYFSIEDEGIGIPEMELDSIFSQFAQSSKTDTGAGGTGLGLSIARDIIEAHDGTIWAENNKDKAGAIFIFSLPLN